MVHFVSFFLCFVFLMGCQSPSTSRLKSSEKIFPIKIVSLSPSTTEILALYSGPKFLKGRTQSCNYPEWVKNIPVVAFIKPNYEKLAEIAPTHILYDAHLYSPYDIQRLHTIGAKLIPVHPLNLEDFFLLLKKIQIELPQVFSAEGYIHKMQSSLDDDSDPPHTHSPLIKVALLYEDGLYREYYMAGTQTFQADLLKKLGCKVVGPHSCRFKKISMESLISLNPDLIFTVKEPSAIIQDPCLKSIHAVQQKQVYQVSPDLLHRVGGRVDQLIALFKHSLNRYKTHAIRKK